MKIDQTIRTSFLPFAMKAYAQLHPGHQLQAHEYVAFVAHHLEEVADGTIKRLVLSMPPRHAKTLLGSICLSAWVLAHKPSSQLLLISYGQELADKIAYSIREILKSDWFRRVFDTRIAKGKLTDVVTTAGGGVRSVSVEGGVTGLGADYIIIDDAVQIKDCNNVRQLQRINELFDSEIRTRLNNPKRGAIVIVAHRLAEDDLPGHALSQGGWKEVRLPLIAPRSRTYKTRNGLVWKRKKGELLRPDAFTSRDIERLRAAKQPDFETLQQQNPGGRDPLQIKAEHLGHFEKADLPPGSPTVLSIDPGQKGGRAHSFSVLQAWAPHSGRYCLLDQWREQARYPELRKQVRRFIRKYRPSVVLVEETGQGPALLSEIKPQQGMKIMPITPLEDKVSRLREHRKKLCAGSVQLPQDAPWASTFIEEVTLFPYATFDDQVDAMTQFLDWVVVNPELKKRAPRSVAAGVSSNGTRLSSRSNPAMEIAGGILARQLPIRRY